jgi:hypothetical protein
MSEGSAAIPPTMGAREIQPAESILESEGWKGITEAPRNDLAREIGKAFAEIDAEKRRDAARAAAIIFETPSLRPFLELVSDFTLRRPTFLPGFGPEALPYAAGREGCNITTWLMWCLVAEGRSETPPHREGT